MLKTRPTRSRWVLPWGTTTVTPQARSDDELLVDLGAGDHQAFATLYDHTAGLVYANIRCVLHDPTRTERVAEETFTEVQRQAARFDPSRTSALIWILDLAHQLATECDRQDDSRAATGPAANQEAPHPSPPVAPHRERVDGRMRFMDLRSGARKSPDTEIGRAAQCQAGAAMYRGVPGRIVPRKSPLGADPSTGQREMA